MKKNCNTGEPTATIPANGHDICNYLARYGMANYQIQTVMKLDGSLDFELLKEAAEIVASAEPASGGLFVKCDPPFWKPVDSDESCICSIEEITDIDGAVSRYLESKLDMDRDPMVKMRLFRSGPEDTLCIKINHTFCDGAGVKEYISLLSQSYSLLEGGNTEELPKPALRTRNDQDRLFKGLGIKTPVKAWKPTIKKAIPFWQFPWRKATISDFKFIVSRLPEGGLGKIKEYTKSRGVTINDMVLTAFYRTLLRISKPLYGVPMEIPVTVDLRRYLNDGRAEAIRNFSGGVDTVIARIPGESFEGTLSRVSHKMRKMKRHKPGLQHAIAAEFVEKMDFQQLCNYYKKISQISEQADTLPFSLGFCTPGLSNLGLISEQPVRFGSRTVTDAYILPPALHPPGLLLLVSTYNGILTLTMAYYKGTVSRSLLRKLLSGTKNELLRGAEK